LKVTVYYPFHPLHLRQLDLAGKARLGDGAVTVVDPSGMRLKIPLWMTTRQAGGYEVSPEPEISARALLELTVLLALAEEDPAPGGSLSETGARPGKREGRETTPVRVRG